MDAREGSTGLSDRVKSERIDLGLEGRSFSASPAVLSSDARHDTRTDRRPAGRHRVCATEHPRSKADAFESRGSLLRTTERAETSARRVRTPTAGPIGRTHGAATSDMTRRPSRARREATPRARAREWRATRWITSSSVALRLVTDHHETPIHHTLKLGIEEEIGDRTRRNREAARRGSGKPENRQAAKCEESGGARNPRIPNRNFSELS